MRIGLSPEQQSFQAEVRAFLEDYRKLDGFFHQDEKWAAVKDFYRALGARTMDEWTVQRVDGDALSALASHPAG